MHQWKFFRSGGFDQVIIESDGDYRNLDQLDQKLWSVLACPVSELNINPDFLALADRDGDGVIRVPEVIQLVNRMNAIFQNSSIIAQLPDQLEISQVRTDTPEGIELKEAIRFILEFTEEPSQSITNDHVKSAVDKLAALAVTGGNAIRVNLLPENDLKAWLAIFTQWGQQKEDPVSKDLIQQIQTEAVSFLQWNKEKGADPATRIFGDNTDNALQIFQAVESKIDDYFNRLDMLDYHPGWVETLNAGNLAGATGDFSIWPAELETYPLSVISNAKNLHLNKGINPAWKNRIHSFHTIVLKEVAGSSKELTSDDWLKVKSVFSPLIRWKQAKPTNRFDGLTDDVISNLAGTTFSVKLESLWHEDAEIPARLNKCRLVSETLLILKNLQNLLVNFVNLRQFYTRQTAAAFQSGVLYLDNRCSELVIRVKDMNSHAAMANLSYLYLVYCECTRIDKPGKLLIAAAYTDGDVDYLMNGRNGLYYDRDGNDWNARIVKILEHPISIRQAFFSPYNRFTRMISSQLEKMAASRDKDVETNAGASIAKTADTTVSQTDGKTQPQSFDVAKFAGIFAAIGLAIGFISSAVVSILTGFLGLSWYQMPLVVLGLMLLISGPSMFLAWLKLRQRNLAPILDANGWAVNTRARINIPFGKSLTKLSRLPAGAQRLLRDPYQEKNTTIPILILLGILAGGLAWCWYMGWLTW